MSRNSVSPIVADSKSYLSPSQLAAADYIGETALQLAEIAAFSRLQLVPYLLCMVWAETHNIMRQESTEGAD